MELLERLVLTTGGATTRIVAVAMFVQPFREPITVYSCVDGGVAMICAPVVALMLECGYHEKFVALPAPPSMVEVPRQIVDESGVTDTVGTGITTRVVVCAAL